MVAMERGHHYIGGKLHGFELPKRCVLCATSVLHTWSAQASVLSLLHLAHGWDRLRGALVGVLCS